MATLIPALSSILACMTPGEKRFAKRLESKLEDDYLLWYDIPIGKQQLHPDFIVLHPRRGLLVLEVKDWKPQTIERITSKEATLLLPNGPTQVKNPLEQAKNYVYHAVRLLQRDAALVHPLGSSYQGKLSFPYGYGAVLTNISRQAFDRSGMDAVMEPRLVICQDEMTESADPEEFQKRLWDMFTYPFDGVLTPAQIDRIRWHIYPDIALQTTFLPEPKESDEIQPLDISADLIRIMDLQQEQLARSLGEGHRIVHGVAGSGKTLILAYRCQFLAQQNPTKPILVLCFNVSLASRLRQILQEKQIGDRVIVRHFHGWCSEQIKIYRIPLPDRDLQGEAYIEQMVNQVILATDKGIIPSGRYSAVAIDEGHDFKPEWFKLVVQMVDPETESVLVLYDDVQNLYQKARTKKFSFKSVGIKAQGRTTILKINYRNTVEVLALAYEFAKGLMNHSEVDIEEDVPIPIEPQSIGRHGQRPELIRLPKFKNELEYISDRARQFHEQGVPWNDMAIVYRSNFMGAEAYQRLTKDDIPVEWLNKDRDSRFYHPEAQSIKLLTMHASKGLEFTVVFIPGLGFLPNRYETPENEARLLYVAMTRTTDRLFMTCDRASPFVTKMQKAFEGIT